MKASDFQSKYGNNPSDKPLTSSEYQAQKKAKPRKPAAKWSIPKQSESQLQTECVNWFRLNYPELAKVFFSVPNGGLRSKRTAATLKKEGCLAGIPDLLLCSSFGKHHGLFIEMKLRPNKPTDNQLEMMVQLAKQGYRCSVAYSFEEFKEIIESYLKAA